ncbi:hypothetical protein [Streptomyces sp. NPDC048489]
MLTAQVSAAYLGGTDGLVKDSFHSYLSEEARHRSLAGLSGPDER